MNIYDVRVALAAALTTAVKRSYAFVAPKIEPPAALVSAGAGSYDDDFAGSMTVDFSVLVLVSRADDRSAQKSLDAYITPTGTSSIKAAIEADRTLGGEVSSAAVTGWGEPQEVELAGVSYLAVEFMVEVCD